MVIRFENLSVRGKTHQLGVCKAAQRTEGQKICLDESESVDGG